MLEALDVGTLFLLDVDPSTSVVWEVWDMGTAPLVSPEDRWPLVEAVIAETVLTLSIAEAPLKCVGPNPLI